MHSSLSLRLIHCFVLTVQNHGRTRADVTVPTEMERRCLMACLDLELFFPAKLRSLGS